MQLTVTNWAISTLIEALKREPAVGGEIARGRLRALPKTVQTAVVVSPESLGGDASINGGGWAYRSVGVRIECYARAVDGRELDVVVDDLLQKVYERVSDISAGEDGVKYEFDVGEEGVACAILSLQVQRPTRSNTLLIEE